MFGHYDTLLSVNCRALDITTDANVSGRISLNFSFALSLQQLLLCFIFAFHWSFLRVYFFLSVKKKRLISCLLRANLNWKCASSSFFSFLSVSDRLADQVNIWPNLCAGGCLAHREESLCHCTCSLLNKSLLYSQLFSPSTRLMHNVRCSQCMVIRDSLLICRNDHGIDNKLTIKGLLVWLVIFYKTGPLFAQCHLVDQELFGGKLTGLLFERCSARDRIWGSRWCGLGLWCAAPF